MSSIFVDVKGNMSPVRPAGRSFTIDELKVLLICERVTMQNLGNFYLAYDARARSWCRFNKIASMWCESAGSNVEVFGSAILIEKDLWKN